MGENIPVILQNTRVGMFNHAACATAVLMCAAFVAAGIPQEGFEEASPAAAIFEAAVAHGDEASLKDEDSLVEELLQAEWGVKTWRPFGGAKKHPTKARPTAEYPLSTAVDPTAVASKAAHPKAIDATADPTAVQDMESIMTH